MGTYFNKKLALTFMLLFTGCANEEYFAIKRGNITYYQYRSFAWIKGPDTAKRSDTYILTENKIIDETTSRLEQKGLVLDASHPDLLLRCIIKSGDDAVNVNEPEYSYKSNWNDPGSGKAVPDYFFRYKRPLQVYIGDDIYRVPASQNALIIDIIDIKLKSVIWRGTYLKPDTAGPIPQIPALVTVALKSLVVISVPAH
jgi:hypothetical protein